MKNTIPFNPLGSPGRTPRWARVLAAISVSSSREAFSLPLALAIGALGMATEANAQTTIFTENLGVPTGTTAIATYATGTAPATFENKGVLTYGQGDITTAAELRATSASAGYTGASGGGNVFFTATLGDRGFSIESIDASAFDTLQLSYAYRKSSNSAFAGLSVDYWNGANWVTIANTSNDLFNELSTAPSGWYPAKTLSLPTGAQVAGLKIRFVKSGNIEIRIDDIRLTGSPIGGDVTNPTVDSLSPPNNSINVATSVSLVANFSEAIKEGTGDIVLETTVGNAPVAASVFIAGSTLTITPTESLDYETSYTVVIPPGSITDLADNEFGGVPETAAWTFTTAPADLTAPLAIAFSPANGATGINPPSSLSITFNEVIQESFDEAFVTVKDSEGNELAKIDVSFIAANVAITGVVATIALPNDFKFDYGTSYYIEVAPGAFEDLAGNAFAGFTGSSTWSFTTVDVPDVTAEAYTQDFSNFTSTSNLPDARVLLPLGWSVTGPDLTYDGNFNNGTTGGFRGNDSVLGYQHTGSTSILVKTLTLRNATGAEITDLVISYVGRAGTVGGRDPFYAVSLNGTEVPALTYSTASNDGVTLASTVSGLSIPLGGTFSISWASDGPNAPGSSGRRQIGISSVSVQAGVLKFAPGVAATAADYATLTQSSIVVNSAVNSDGGSEIIERGFVYSVSAIDPNPIVGGSGVTTVIDTDVLVGPYSANLSGLTSTTQYSVRSYATNSQGTTYSSVLDIFTLGSVPILVTDYFQPFNNFSGSIVNGTLPTGWTVTSTGGLNSYAGSLGPATSSGGLLGGVSNPGVLGYQHTSGTGVTTMTLELTNGTGKMLDKLYVSYLGRVDRVNEGRSPAFIVSINGSPAPDLAYSTSGGVDANVSSTLTSLGVQPGALIAITWTSDRGAGRDSSKQIGLADVYVGLEPPVLNTYANWATTNVGGQGPSLDFDGDGVPNGVEYFMGSSPTAFTTTPGILAGAVTWPRAADTTISSFTVEVSTNLSTWEDATVNYAANLNITASEVVFTMPAGPTKLFVRLNVVP